VQVHPQLLNKEMVTLFINTLKALYYKHVMGSLTHQFTDIVVIVKRIKQEIRSGRIFMPIEKNAFRGKKEVDLIESGCKSKKGQFQNYNTPSSSSQIANINFNSQFPKEELNPKLPQNNQIKNQTENFPMKNYQKSPRTVTPVTTILNRDVPKATEHRASSSSTTRAFAATLPQLV